METSNKKSQTTRISLADIIASKNKSASSPPITTKAKPEASKRNTTRIILMEEDDNGSAPKTISKAETEAITAIPIQQPAQKSPPTTRFKKPSTTQLTSFAAKKGDTTSTVARAPVSVAAPTDKRHTSRIVLQEELPAPGKSKDLSNISSPIVGIPVESEAPKTTSHPGAPVTIKLRRSASTTPPPPQEAIERGPAPKTIRILKEQSAISEAPTVVKKTTEPLKRGETSRIAIEDIDSLKKEVLSTAPTVADQKPPRTIRLKRPSDLEAVPEISETKTEEQLDTAKKSETSKIQLPQLEEAPSASASQTPLTQRKTIKIKRTDRAGQMRTISLKRPDEKEIAQSEDQAVSQTVEDIRRTELGAVWSFVALVAVFCVIGLVYLLASQSLGPAPVLPVPFEY
jgi:hypothetical protein